MVDSCLEKLFLMTSSFKVLLRFYYDKSSKHSLDLVRICSDYLQKHFLRILEM